MQTRMNQFYYGAIFLLALLIFPSLAMAEQAESSIACDEGVISEPILLNYGNHTTGCEIGTTVDLDLFQFGATAGDQIRIIVDGRTGDFDPRIELRAPDGSVVQDTFCNPGGNTCTVTVPETLTDPGTYQIAVTDAGANETGNYALSLHCLFGPCPTQTFSDVPPGHWAASYIATLADNGITSGCGGGNYCPANPVTRLPAPRWRCFL